VTLVVAVLGTYGPPGPAGVAMRRPPRPRFGQPDRADQGDRAQDDADNAGHDFPLDQAYHAQQEVDGENGDRRPPRRGPDVAGQEAGSADERPGDRQHAEDRVDRFPPFARPVHILEVQPEREFVDGEADAHPEDGGGDAESRPARRRGHQDDARADDDQYAEDLMMNVLAGDLDVAQPGAGAAA
jgi:hypothetical protein